MTDQAIRKIWSLLLLLFAAVIVRQIIVQVLQAPAIANRGRDPRRASPAALRGRILANDGTPLALTHDGVRRYPLGAALAQIIGYDDARYGTSGIEHAFDGSLSAPQGLGDPATQLRALLDAFLGKVTQQHGADLVTTIHPAIQRVLYDDLARYPRAAGVAMDPRTGAILAIASLPSFDPNRLDDVFPRLVNLC